MMREERDSRRWLALVPSVVGDGQSESLTSEARFAQAQVVCQALSVTFERMAQACDNGINESWAGCYRQAAQVCREALSETHGWEIDLARLLRSLVNDP